METSGQGENTKDSGAVASHSGNGSRLTAALGSHSRQTASKATGPRTAAGKRRSRYNALKSGLFAKGLLLRNESRAEYDSLLSGLQEHFRPQGKVETALVENLAVILWRKRRLFQAERAQVEEAVEFKTSDSTSAQMLEAWDLSRAGETSGGMLRHTSNCFVIQEAIEILKVARLKLEKCGFEKDEELRFLRKLYGLDHDGDVPVRLFRMYVVYSKLATNTPREGETFTSPDQLKKEMLEMLDEEIRALTFRQKRSLAIHELRGEFQNTAALIPSQGDLDRVIRYEAHLSREFDRTISQLERLQKIRLGQPTPPTLRVDISRE